MLLRYDIPSYCAVLIYLVAAASKVFCIVLSRVRTFMHNREDFDPFHPHNVLPLLLSPLCCGATMAGSAVLLSYTLGLLLCSKYTVLFCLAFEIPCTDEKTSIPSTLSTKA